MPFILPSQLNEIYPKADKFISRKTKCSIENLKAQKNTVLLTRSGMVGECNFVSKTFEGLIFSDDVIRILSKKENEIGYIYAYFKSSTGKTLIKNNNYGAVINHIEPEHLENVQIPYPEESKRKEIHDLIITSFALRDESNGLIDKAQELLKKELRLLPIDEMKPKYFNDEFPNMRSFSVSFAELDNRFDGSYHLPIVKTILEHIKKYAKEVVSLGDERIAQEILLPGRFKRNYVDEGRGCVFLRGKQIKELDPANKKYLSLRSHNARIKKELTLKENMILVTRSGTIGKSNIVPKCWENWIINEHVLRIFPKNQNISGYIYAWLSSNYGSELITRFTYGTVVDEIDADQLSQVQIPLLKNQEIQKEINDLVLTANKKRYEAYLKEQKAIEKIEEIIKTQ